MASADPFVANMQPRLYLAGSDRDVQASPAANIAIVTAGAFAIAAIASGLIINFQSKPRGDTQLPSASSVDCCRNIVVYAALHMTHHVSGSLQLLLRMRLGNI